MPRPEIDSKTLTSLIIMQMMLRELSRGGDVFGFICRGLLDVPGVTKVDHVEGDRKASGESVRAFPVRMGAHHYGSIVIELSSKDEFYPYEAYIGNLAFMTAAVLDEERGRKESEDHRRQLEEKVEERTMELKKAQERAEDYLRVSEAMILELDTDACVTVVNDRGCSLLGYTREEMIGKNWIELAVPPDARGKVAAIFEGVIRGEETAEYYDNGVLRKDGEHLDIAWHNVPLHDDEGNITGTLSSGIDITARLTLEEMSQRAQRMESMGVLAGGVAHDLNNLLGPLVGLPQMLMEDLADDDSDSAERRAEMRESLELIDSCARRAIGVVKDLLVMGRRRRYDLEALDINSCIADCVEQINRDSESSIAVETYLSKEPSTIFGERSSLSRVLGNLLRNAVEAIDGKGIVTVSTSAIELEEKVLGSEMVPPGRYVVVEVADSGSGISESHIDRIFEPFFSQKVRSESSGSGLGLAVVHGIVKDHGGYIDVCSEKGAGTWFRLYFPRHDAASPRTENVAPTEAAAGKGRILVVDDEKSQRYIARKFLVKAGYTVTESISGSTALTLFTAASDEGQPQPYDAVVLDMIMEDGFDGLETLKAIRGLYPETPVVVASGHAPSDRSAEAARLGARWLQKPYTMNALLTEVSDVLKR